MSEKGKKQSVAVNKASVPIVTSVETVKRVYRELNAKNQQLSKFFKEQHICRFNNLKQLVYQIEQAVSQHGCIASNWTFTVLYLNDVQSQITSIAEFESYDTSQSSPVESVSVEFDYLTHQSENCRPEAHKIELTLVSDLALRVKAAESFGAKLEDMVKGSDTTGWVKVEHSNYLIGKYLLSTVENWYASLEKIEVGGTQKFLKFIRGWLPTIFRFSFQLIFVVFIFVFALDTLFSNAIGAQQNFINAVWILFCFYAFSQLFWRFGVSMEKFAQQISHASAVLLNSADEKLLLTYGKTKSRPVIKTLIGYSVSFVLSVLASLFVIHFTG